MLITFLLYLSHLYTILLLLNVFKNNKKIKYELINTFFLKNRSVLFSLIII